MDEQPVNAAVDAPARDQAEVAALEPAPPSYAATDASPLALRAGFRPVLFPAEPRWLGAVCVVLAVLVAATLLYSARFYWVGVHPGVDQNGYLVGGKQFARTLTMKLRPTLPGTNELDPHQFVGRMWVGADLLTPAERYYPKYPAGLPLLYAIGLWAGGEEHGAAVVYWINPVAMTIAVWMTFWLARRLAGSIAGLLAMLLFATSPVTLALTTNPNSHATAVCCVVSGMFFLLQWWRKQSGWRAFAAGFLLGYAVTIRYTEGTLLLPAALVAVFALRWRDRQSWKQAGLLALGWLIPVGGLVGYNLGAMGTFTGYDPTNESLGFSLDYALDNWETMLRQLATTGLFFVLPLALAGGIAMFWRNWRTATVMAAWVLPCVVIYTFYYWAPDTSTVGYMRFYLTILPALATAAAWCGRAVVDVALVAGRPAAGAALACVAAVMTVAAAAQLQQGLELVEADQLSRLSVRTSVEQIERAVPDGSTILCADFNLLHHLQFVRDDLLYAGETFTRGGVLGLIARYDPGEPQGLDPSRRAATAARFGEADQKTLDEEQAKVIHASLNAGRRVFAILPVQGAVGLPRSGADPEVYRRGWPDFLRRAAKGTTFDLASVGSWNVPQVRAPAERGAPRAKRAQVRQDRHAGYWQVVEITKKPPPPPRPRPPATTRASPPR